MTGLFDLEYHENKIREYQPPLTKLDRVINWELFREPIETALYIEPKGAGGRPPYDKIMMFKILILQNIIIYLMNKQSFRLMIELLLNNFLI